MIAFLLSHLRAKLMVLVLLPLAAGAALTAIVMYRQNQVVLSLEPLTATSRLAVSLGDLIHVLQAERSATALFQGARGQSGAQEMRIRRQGTDRAAVAFTEALPSAPPAAEAEQATQALTHLRELRQGVETGRTATQLLDDYTALIGTMLSLQDRLVLPAAGTPLESRFHALSALAHGKEQAELERAILANAFSNQAFLNGQRERYIGIVAVQAALETAFAQSAPKAWMEAYTREVRSAEGADFTAFRAMALSQAPKLPDVDPFQWSMAATPRQEAFKRLEIQFSRTLVQEAEGMEASARRTRIGLLIGALAFGAIVLAWTHLTGQAVLRPLQTLEEAFSRLRAGDLSVRLPVVGRDETARMTEAFNLTCEQLASMTSLLKEAAHRVAGEAKGLSASADRVSGTTIQLARTTLTQRQATEQVAAAMLQLGASVEAQEDNLSRVREEGRRATDLAMDCRSLAQESTEVLEAVHRRSEQLMEASATLTELARGLAAALAGHSEPAIRESLANSVRSAEEAVALVIQNLEGMQKGRSRLDAMTFALEETLVGLATMDRLAEEIRLVTRDQVAASREVTQRMAETTRGTGEVQLAAAQLANTVPEVNHTARELAGVAMGLASTADTFTLG